MTTTPEHPERPATEALSPREILELQEQGRRSALGGQHPSACPWGTHRPQDRQRQRAWIRGFVAGRTELRQDAETGPETT